MFQGSFEGKKVLVTGHTGFKGSWLCAWLQQLGAEVSGYSLYLPSTPSLFEEMGLASNLRHHTGDVRDLAALEKVFAAETPDIVFHLAAQPIVHTSYEDPRGTFETNVMGMVNVLEAIRRAPSVRAGVLITSDKCYENVEWEFGYRETDRLGGKDPYSASKACAEVVFSSYVRSFFQSSGAARIATTRAGNVIGGGDWARARIVPDCVRSWAEGKTVEIRSPRATRPWQHVLEPLSGYLQLGAGLLGDAPQLAGEAFNFGPSADVNQPVSVLIEEMRRHWKGGQWRDAEDPSNPMKEAGLLKLSCDKALHRLGWQATLNFEETVRLTTEWYVEHYDAARAGLRAPASGQAGARARTERQIAAFAGLAKERGRSWAKF